MSKFKVLLNLKVYNAQILMKCENYSASSYFRNTF